MSFEELATEALKLPPEDQARLLHQLAVALDSEGEPELTNEELERRWAGFEQGSDPGIDSTELRARAMKKYGLV